ncbi:hypothetical protein FOZ62_032571 [Perkinsus olseni]|uniref:Membrane transporter protein n=1 Tax=Perkinsus olseni TaxID=32597 RepID=A0A7J6QW19_PEROL|nr:hypothetical protein FOZ62_032571 [Perkinsus olseni]
MIFPGFPTTIVFTMLLRKWSNEADTLKAVLGVLLFLVGIWQLINEFWKLPASSGEGSEAVLTKKKLLGASAAGAATGAMVGLFSIGGPPMMVWVLLAEPDALTWRGTSALIFTVNNVGRLPTMLTSGLLRNVDIAVVGSIVVGSICGVLAGNFLAHKISATSFRRAVIFILVASSIFMLHATLRILTACLCVITVAVLAVRRYRLRAVDAEGDTPKRDIELQSEKIGLSMDDRSLDRLEPPDEAPSSASETDTIASPGGEISGFKE